MQEQKLMYALNKYDPNRGVSPMEMLNNYDKPGALPSSNKKIEAFDQIKPVPMLGGASPYGGVNGLPSYPVVP